MTGKDDGATVAGLSTRLARHDYDGDDAVLLDHTVHERALGLHATVLAQPDGRTDVATLRVLGRWFLRRYQALPAGTGQADLRSARLYAGLLRDLGDSAIPDELRELLHDHHNIAVRTNETALALLHEFHKTGDERQVAAAGALIGSLDATLPVDHPMRRELLTSISVLASTRAIVGRDITAVDATVSVTRAGLAAAEPGEETVPHKILLVGALILRYEMSSQLSYLDEAQELAERTLRDYPDVLPIAPILAYILLRRFDTSHRPTDLDRAVTLSRDAVRAIPSGHPSFESLMETLCFCLLRRVEYLETEADLTEAIDMCRAMLPMLDTDGPARCSWLRNLAMLLVMRMQRTGATADLAEAANFSREAVALSGHLRWRTDWVLFSHAAIMSHCFSVNGRREDLVEAINSCRQGVDAGPVAVNVGVFPLGLALLLAMDHVGDPGILDEAVALGDQAIAALPASHPLHVHALYSSAFSHDRRYRVTGDRSDLDTATDLSRAAALSPVGKPDLRMQAARRWMANSVLVGDLPAAAEAGEAGVALLPILAWRGLDRSTQEERLADVSGMASVAAALAIETGKPRRAVELIEQGRSVLWSQALQTRSDLSALRSVDPDLAVRLDQTRRSLNRMATDGSTGLGDHDRLARHYRVEVERWETLLARARALPGFGSFLDTTPFDELCQAAMSGCVVIVNVSEARCDALLVRHTGVQIVPLPWLSLRDAYRRAEGLLAAVADTEPGVTRPAWTHLRQTLISLLRWTWDVIAEPVLDAMDAASPELRHRVWWCPTGPLTLLPLHAAGRYGSSTRWGARRRPTVPDRTLSSYATGLGTLHQARNRPVTSDSATLLAVGMPATPGRSPLPAVVDELSRITATIVGTRTLIGAAATPNTVLAELGRHTWAHFACHATQRVDQPAASALHLSGGDLTVLRCAGQELVGAEFAFLSACHTAGGSMELADEAINLAAGLQLAGYRHVVGTLWPVSDTHAAAVADAVYPALTAGGRPNAALAATALATATTTLREQHPDHPEIWAPFIHLGP